MLPRPIFAARPRKAWAMLAGVHIDVVLRIDSVALAIASLLQIIQRL
jgi:hypothetical protein